MKLDTSPLVDSAHLLPNEKKKSKNNWLPWLLILFLLGAFSYAVYRQLVIVPAQQARRAILTHPVERQSLAITVSANGTIKPERSINVSPKNAGVLKTLLVKEGDNVKQGQILAKMDDSNLQGQFTQAQGQLAQQEANLRKLIAVSIAKIHLGQKVIITADAYPVVTFTGRVSEIAAQATLLAKCYQFSGESNNC